MLRWTIRIAVLLVLLLLMASVAFVIYLDHIAARVVTSSVEAAGGSPCKVGRMDVSLLSGRIRMERFAVMNPQGYPDAEMFSTQAADLEVQIRTLWRQPIHIRYMKISNPIIRVEAGRGRSNIRVFLDNVDRYLGKDENKWTRMRIDKLVIEGPVVRFGSAVTAKDLMSISLENVELGPIHGKGDRGVHAGELSAIIVTELVRAGVAAGGLDVERFIPPGLMESLNPLMIGAETMIKTAGGILKTPWRALIKRPATAASRPAERTAPP